MTKVADRPRERLITSGHDARETVQDPPARRPPLPGTGQMLTGPEWTVNNFASAEDPVDPV